MLHWIDIIWLAIACTAALLGFAHLTIWLRQRSVSVHGVFALLSFSVTGCAIAERLAMRAQTTAEYGLWLSWGHLAVLPIIATMVIFVGFTGPSRAWLAIAVIGTRIAATVANFTTGDSLSFVEITALRQLPVWGGDTVSVPMGVTNPWLALAQFSNLLLVAFIIDVIVSLWRLPRSSERSRGLRIALAALAFLLAPVCWNLPVQAFGVPLPMVVSPAYLLLALVMSYELFGDLLRAERLAQSLRLKDREISLQRDEMAHMMRVGLLSELSGSLAHELNQPLAAILSNAQASMRFLNRETPDLNEVREALAQIIDSDKRAGEIIRQLRAMLREDASNMRPLSLNEVVRDILCLVHSDLVNRQVLLREDLGKDLPIIHGDRVQLQQVILNLTRNACDAMRDLPEGGVLTLTTSQAPGGVLLQVADVGHGIAEVDLERIFEPFVSTKPDGLGFGLSLSASLIQAHGGRLWASNNADRGATLHVFLPTLESAS